MGEKERERWRVLKQSLRFDLFRRERERYRDRGRDRETETDRQRQRDTDSLSLIFLKICNDLFLREGGGECILEPNL